MIDDQDAIRCNMHARPEDVRWQIEVYVSGGDHPPFADDGWS